jgi:hypothetical protein
MQTEQDRSWFVFKRLLQRVELDPNVLEMFVQILCKKHVKFGSVIVSLGGGKGIMSAFLPAMHA